MSFVNNPDRPWDPPNLLLLLLGYPSPEIKWTCGEDCNSYLSSSKFKNECKSTSTSPYALITFTGTNLLNCKISYKYEI